jgi:hypothetical protein
MRSRFSFASVSSSILEAVRNVQGAYAEHGRGSRDVDRSHPPDHLCHVEEAVILDNDEQGPEASGDGWQEFKKGMHVVLFPVTSH